MVRFIMIFAGLGLFVCLTIVTTATTYARDFSKYGITTEIKEEGFLAMIARKLKEVDMTKEQARMQKLAQERINEPAPVAGIIRTTKARSYSFDPTFTLREDIRLPCGMLLYPKGTKVNPLDHMDLARKMIFIDARDKSQEHWLKAQIKEPDKDSAAHGNNKDQEQGSNEPEQNEVGQNKIEQEELVIILVGGRPLELQERLSHAVWFDQGGVLTSKFGIKQVPATVVQEESMLRIEEIYLGSSYVSQ